MPPKKKYRISCNCGQDFIGTLDTICPTCTTFQGGYTNELTREDRALIAREPIPILLGNGLQKEDAPTVGEMSQKKHLKGLWPTVGASSGGQNIKAWENGKHGLRLEGAVQLETENKPAPPDPSAQLLLLPEDSLVSLSVLPGSEEARRMTAGSGQRILGLYQRSGPLGLLQKMLADYSNWRSMVVYLKWQMKPMKQAIWIQQSTMPLLNNAVGNWKKTVMKSRRFLFQLVPSTPRTDEIEFSLWATPTTQEIDHQNMEVSETGRRLTKDKQSSHSLCLADQVKGLWATPNTMDSLAPKSEKALYKEATEDRRNRSKPGNLRDQVSNKEVWDSFPRRDYSLLPTPSAQMAGEGKFLETLETKEGETAKPGERAYNPKTGDHVQITLNRAVKLWPTPKGRDWKGQSQRGIYSPQDCLPNAVKLWPTPRAHTDTGGNQGMAFLDGGSHDRQKLKEIAGEEEGKAMSGGQLNPPWVEKMMGFPEGWTETPEEEVDLLKQLGKETGRETLQESQKE